MHCCHSSVQDLPKHISYTCTHIRIPRAVYKGPDTTAQKHKAANLILLKQKFMLKNWRNAVQIQAPKFKTAV